MVPSLFIELDQLPLNPNGKLDRKALTEPDFTIEAREYRAPSTPTEEVLVQLFVDLLGLERIGVDDDFFALGGNSLSATRAVARINANFGVRIDVREFFDTPTVAQLGVLGDAAVATSGEDSGRPALTAGVRPERIPLSLAQQRLWFLNRFEPESAAYNIPVVIRLTGELDVAALAAAVADVLGRHEALRTVYPEVDGTGCQVIVPVAQVPVDLTPASVSGVDELRASVAELVGRGFDVTAAVPVRVRLFRLDESEHVLAVVVHHISGDGVSTGPLARDLVVAYAARHGGHEPGWAPLAVQYADYTLWQREVLGSESDPGSLLSRQLGYWSKALAGLPDVLELPSDRPRPAVRSGAGARVEFAVPAAIVTRMQSVAREHHATMFMVVHAALSVLLARLSGTSDIAVGTPVAGRGEEALDDLVGMFVNTLVLRAEFEPGRSFADLLAEVRESDLAGFGYADVPFERLVQTLNPVRSQSFSPLFQVLLAFQNFASSAMELPGLTIAPLDAGRQAAQFDLSVILPEDPAGTMTGQLEYATDIFDESTARGIAQRLVRVLEQVVAEPSTPVGDVEILEPAERRRMLDGWNQTGHEVPEGLLLAGFAARVAATRDAVAGVFGDQSLTYAELDARVNRLARYLISRGVGPESLVGVAMGRSIEMVVGICAVLEAGGGYVPLDPDQPVERTTYVLDTAAPVAVLTTSRDGFDVVGDRSVLTIDTLELSGFSTAPVRDAERVAPVRAENTAYAIFTSGSTGRPKGVAVSHRAIVNQLAWMADEYGFDSSDVVLHKAPITFDVSVWELFLPLRVGAKLVVARPDGHRDPEYL